MEIVLAVVLLGFVAAFVAIPLRESAAGEGDDDNGSAGEDPVRADLEARRDSKYREIRDAELDREQGKLTDEDWARIDAELRHEAIEILRELDRLSPG